MKIQTLTLKNFRSHREKVLALDRLNFIRGANGCGKSSIQMALEYLLTGRCQLTAGAGRGVDPLIRTGEKELEVSATLENGDAICRRRSARSHVVEINGKRIPVDTAEAILEKRFGSADVLSAVLNADRFVEMSDAEQKKFFAHVVDAGRIEIPQKIHDALRTIGDARPKLASIRDVEAAHKRFLGLYEEASRALKALGQRLGGRRAGSPSKSRTPILAGGMHRAQYSKQKRRSKNLYSNFQASGKGRNRSKSNRGQTVRKNYGGNWRISLRNAGRSRNPLRSCRV